MANFETLKEDIKILVEELGETEITSDIDFIQILIDKWSSTLANYLSTVVLVPANILANYNSEAEEDETDSIDSSPPNPAFLKSAIAGGLVLVPGFGLPIPGSFLLYLLNGIDAGHLAIAGKAATEGITAIPPVAFRPATESVLSGLLSIIPGDDDVQIQNISIAIDSYTKLGTWTLPNGATGNWS